MQQGKLKFRLPYFPIFAKLSTKLALGLVLLFLLLDYQPSLSFPPAKKSTVRAQTNEQTQKIEAKSLPFVASLPHPGYISTHFSFFHPGIDIATGLGVPIHPVAKGVVIGGGLNFWGLGLVVNIDHGNGYHSLYAHMGKIYVQKGQTVDTNDILGIVGLTGNTSGPHTHLELSKDGKNFDPQTILPSIGEIPKPEYLIAAVPSTQSAQINTTSIPTQEKPVEISKPQETPETKLKKAIFVESVGGLDTNKTDQNTNIASKAAQTLTDPLKIN